MEEGQKFKTQTASMSSQYCNAMGVGAKLQSNRIFLFV